MRRNRRTIFVSAVAAAGVLLLGAGARAQIPLNVDVVNMSGYGFPLLGVLAQAAVGNTANLELFADGQIDFAEVESLPAVGPVFNSRSCGGCHFQPALGGSGGFINEIRVRKNTTPGPVQIFGSDNILRLGAQTQGGLTIFPGGLESSPLGCQITSPTCARSACQREEATRTTFATTLRLCDPTSASFAAGQNCSAERQSTPLFGFGFVEAIADATFSQIANGQPVAIRGTVKTVNELGRTRVARFGWKDDVATLRGFAGDAYLQEMGITNPDFPSELSTCALNKTQFGVLLDAADDPEDTTDDEGRADVDHFADFMRMLDPPPTLNQNASAQGGKALFGSLGCQGCHVASITTSGNPSAFVPTTTGGVSAVANGLNAILANRTIHPYSDFLLHDMGSLGDGITSGVAGPRMMRTAPLWGVRGKVHMLHDGRAEGLEDAILLHDGQGAAARDAFNALTDAQKQQVIDFLNTI
jgi:di-heme oxidoreductase (putative peroxidase)